MGKATPLTADTVIQIGKSIPLYAYHRYFEEVTGKALPGQEFQGWLNTQAGKTLGEAAAAYIKAAERKSMADTLAEERFSIVSAPDKAFILAFDEGMQKLGYDFGGGIGEGYVWGKHMVIYAKTGVKAKKVAARIFIREGGIVLRLFLNNIDKHRAYIEGAPGYIKDVFTGSHGACSCSPKKENCRMRKTYTLGGSQYEKCSGVVFEFWDPIIEKCPGYLGLLGEFY